MLFCELPFSSVMLFLDFELGFCAFITVSFKINGFKMLNSLIFN